VCRNIKPLRKLDHPVTDEEVHDAALQYVRKVSGYRKPSQLNAGAFDLAVNDIAQATKKLLAGLQSKGDVISDVQLNQELR